MTPWLVVRFGSLDVRLAIDVGNNLKCPGKSEELGIMSLPDIASRE